MDSLIANSAVQKIQAILFDMGSTLRHRIPEPGDEQRARAKVKELLRSQDDALFDELNRRFGVYARWAQERMCELPEIEIWTRWVLREYPAEQIAPIASQLGFAFRERNGRSVIKPDANATIEALSRRGYRLGLISNTTSAIDSPDTLEQAGMSKYFETMILSTVCGIRKPSPEIFWLATRAMNIDPACCAYLGDRISRDVVGSRNAGFAMAILIEPLGKPRLDEQDQTAKPDKVIHELSELLNIFPSRKQIQN